jgi:hypothetical protein
MTTEKKKEYLNWINDQIKDMYSNEYIDTGINRVFKTQEDDRGYCNSYVRNYENFT